MAPVDPGSTVLWAKNPAYTVSLVAAITTLPRAEADSLFSSAKSKSTQWKANRQAALDTVTRLVFTAHGDPAREKKQKDSIARRIVQLVKEYRDSLGELRQNPYEVPATLDDLRERYPHWDQLRSLLKDHPEMEQWDENADQARDSDSAEGIDEAMQDVHYPHQPVAGPSGHNNGDREPSPPTPHRGVLERQPDQRAVAIEPSPHRPHRPDRNDPQEEARESQNARDMRQRAEAAAVRRLQRLQQEGGDEDDDDVLEGDDVVGALRGGRMLARRRSASPTPRRDEAVHAGEDFAEGQGIFYGEGLGEFAAQDDTDSEEEQDRQDFDRPGPNDPRAAPLDEDAFTSCPKCSTYLLDLTSSDSQAHIRACLDGADGAHLEFCPVCERSLSEPGWDRKRAEQHVDECCQALTGGGPGTGGERKNRRDHVVFVCDVKSVPKDEKTGEALECSFCLDDFAPDTSLARLSCYCIYHEACINEYWGQPGDKFCPLHRDLDGISEVDMHEFLRLALYHPRDTLAVQQSALLGSQRYQVCMGTLFYSRDLNVSVSGTIISERDSGEAEGTVLELASGPEAVHILVTISTRPESQTLRSINTGEPLFTLDTPLLRAESTEDRDEDGDSPAEPNKPSKANEQRRITLHSGLVPASHLDVSTVQSSPFFSQTFSILIDAPSFPPPHFDPSSLAPPTPSFRAVDHNSSTFPGVLNSPTLQRALLSPLLSPQRRAASQGSDMSVPPLSLGLSRTSRASFSADNRTLRSNSSHQASGLTALIPSLAPSPHSSGHSSANPTASPSISAVPQTPPTSASDPHSLAAALTASVSGSARKTAEDILALRRNHDGLVRRAKAELEVLEARIESVRNGASGGNVVGGGGVVRGFGVPLIVRKEKTNGQDRSPSGSRERGRSAGRGAGRTGSLERSTLGSNAEDRKDSPSARGGARDEDVSSKMRELDQREEDERGRSRSRQRRRDDPRSVSRSKKIAEATEAAALGARERDKRGESSKEREPALESTDRTIPATLADGEDDEDDGQEDERSRSVNPRGALRPSSGTSTASTTPSFIPSTSTKGLVAIPESEELSLARSESSRAASPNSNHTKTRQRTATTDSDRDEDAPFEMDEDVDVDFIELPSSRPIFQQQPPDFGSFEPPEALRSPGLHPSTSTFRPGSLQRTSSLSASYAALLSSSTSSHRPTSPLDGPLASGGATPSSGVASRDHQVPTTVQEGGKTSPDPRNVRQGEQKIRDVLAIDVPSHRRALPRKTRTREGGELHATSPSASDSDRDEGEEDKELLDSVGDLASSSTFQVGSLPIPLANRPSSRAMSSWRPDPEREWALEREKRAASGGGANRPSKEGASWIPPPVDPSLPADEQSSTPRAVESTPAAVPLEIGGGSTSSQGVNRSVGGSSLAQSLRNAPVESFAARVGREQGGAATTGEQLHISSMSDGDVGEAIEEDEEEEDGVFLPPHLVADRRARKDEKYLSRSVTRS
ncbi:hypothetical protein JCM11491_000983 [Sporobolomyces phaffii]